MKPVAVANPGFHSLDPVHRMLLTTDGTLTELLQAICLENITAIVITQRTYPAEHRIDLLELEPGDLLLDRTVLLRGRRTGATYVYAESLIAINRVDETVRRGLLESETPLGLIWKSKRIEAFKEVLEIRCQPAGEISRHFGTDPDSAQWVRRCRISVSRRPVMLIEEHLADNYWPNSEIESMKSEIELPNGVGARKLGAAAAAG